MIVITPSIMAQDISGAYITEDNSNQHLILITDGYITHTTFTNDTYISTQGGTYTIDDDKLMVKFEFDDKSTENIGQTHQFSLAINNNGLIIDGVNFTKEASKPQELDGLWRITGRKVSNEMNTIPKGDRKTIKILVDGYFQWIAINPAEKGFYGTGGGKYDFSNGNYQENILFFSRDDSRIGASLKFKGKLENQQWHHSGKSSKGDPIYEIWSRDQ
jgi:hypothetical protein